MTDRTDLLEKLLLKVKEVRDKQRTYFKLRRINNVSYPDALQASKQAERELDELVKEIDKASISDTQEKLF
jgi:hypothetical protein